MRLIGISGRRGAGKDTLAARWQEEHPPTAIVGFADCLKDELIRRGLAFGRNCYGTQADKVFVRKLMQDARAEFGYGRGYVVAATVRRVEDWRAKGVAYCLIPDVRYPEEVQAIWAAGGKVVRLTRTPHPEDAHESETALDGFKGYDLTIYGNDPDYTAENAYQCFADWEGAQ